ncbi:hypothetical protein ACFQ3Z_00720 [Streptomyces nogalater]
MGDGAYLLFVPGSGGAATATAAKPSYATATRQVTVAGPGRRRVLRAEGGWLTVRPAGSTSPPDRRR